MHIWPLLPCKGCDLSPSIPDTRYVGESINLHCFSMECSINNIRSLPHLFSSLAEHTVVHLAQRHLLISLAKGAASMDTTGYIAFRPVICASLGRCADFILCSTRRVL